MPRWTFSKGRSKVDLPGKLAAITTIFSPAGYKKIWENYHEFAEGMHAHGIDFWTLEIAFGDEDFVIRPSNRVIQIRTNDILWLKERAINLLIELLPREYDKVAWVDADLLFENKQWFHEAEQMLEHHPIVQCYSTVQRLTRCKNGIEMDKPSTAKLAQMNHPIRYHLPSSSPGGAWAARRTLLSQHSLFDKTITGGSDAFTVLSLYGWDNHPLIQRVLFGSLQRHFLSWFKHMYSDVKGNVGCIEGRVKHLWHGSIDNRQHWLRFQILKQNEFDPAMDITIGSNGLWQWSSNKPALHREVLEYFVNRKDDG